MFRTVGRHSDTGRATYTGLHRYNGTTVNGIAIWLTTPVSLASSSPNATTNNNALSALNLNFLNL